MYKRNMIFRCVVVLYFGMVALSGYQDKGNSRLESIDKRNHDQAPYNDRFDGIRSKILEVIKETGIASISAAVAEEGRIVKKESRHLLIQCILWLRFQSRLRRPG